MESVTARDTVQQLAADFGWLERHCLAQPDLAKESAQLRLAAALTRNVVGPALEGVVAPPLHLVVVGGAGAGKSTVVNFLVGSVVADANPQAGFTRHPTAFAPPGVALPSTVGFLGPLRRVVEESKADRDEDIYHVTRVAPEPPAGEFVVWDCPDMTTWASGGYVGRLLEAIGLADVVIYVASDERYNDEIPTQFLHHVARTGKAIVCALTKMRPDDADKLVAHFRGQVLTRLPGGQAGSVPVVPMPDRGPEQRKEPGGAGRPARLALWNEILALCPDAAQARARTVSNAVHYLQTASDGLLGVARRDLAVSEEWKTLVDAGREEFEARYRREYLSGEAFGRFDRAKAEALELLDLPGGARVLSGVLGALRWPYKAARDALVRLASRPPVPAASEREVCELGLDAWLDGLQAHALARADAHPAWRAIARDFDSGLKGEAAERFGQVFRQFAARETDELDRAVAAVPKSLAESPALLGLLRAGRVLLDLGLVVAVVVLTWVPSVYALLLIPVAVGLAQQAVELAVGAAVDVKRSRVRDRREELVRQSLSGPVAEWLTERPTAGASDLGELRRVLARVPRAVRALAERLKPQGASA